MLNTTKRSTGISGLHAVQQGAGETTLDMAIRLFHEMGGDPQAAGNSTFERLFGPGGQGGTGRHKILASQNGPHTGHEAVIPLREEVGDSRAEVAAWYYAGTPIYYAISGGKAVGAWGAKRTARGNGYWFAAEGLGGEVIPDSGGGRGCDDPLTIEEVERDWYQERRKRAARAESARLTVRSMIAGGDSRARLSPSGKVAYLTGGGQEIGQVCIGTQITVENVSEIRCDYKAVESMLSGEPLWPEESEGGKG